MFPAIREKLRNLNQTETPATQAARRLQIFEMGGVLASQCFDQNGHWILPGNSPDARERIWLCFALMCGGPNDKQLANAILADTKFQQHVPARSEAEKVHPFDIFVSNHAVQMLVLHADKLTEPVRLKIESWAKLALNDYPGDRQADYQFHGYNDNMPSKACMGMILGGEYFKDSAAVEHGLWSLRQLRDMLTRRGLISEYNSPTYSPVTLAGLIEVAKYARHPEARSLAAKCVERVWADLLGHFHPPTGLLAGPYSRAYTTDSAGQLSSANLILWLAFGEGVWPNPLQELCIEPPRMVLHHEGDLYFVLATYCWLAAFEYEPPARLVDWLKSRTYPYGLVATAERGEGGNGGWAASEMLCTTHQDEDFALATSEGDWDGQTDEFFLQYRCRTPARGAQDVRTAFHRFLINEDLPGKTGSNHNGLSTGEQSYLQDMGRSHTLQKDGVAIVSVSAHPKLIDKPLTRMGCAFILSEHQSSIPKIEWGDGHVWIQDGPFYLAVRPLGATNLGRGEPVQIQRLNHYRMIWLPNYEGPERKFSRAELATIVNGFIVVGSGTRHESFDDFRARILQGQLLDYVGFGSRTLRYKLGNLELGLCYGIESNGVRFATINGKIAPRPVWQATRLPAEQLPFLDGPPVPNTLELPFEHLRVIWAPEAHWQIFSRGVHRADKESKR